MTPTEKAKELVDKFIPFTRTFDNKIGWCDSLRDAKKCATISVNEIIKTLGIDNIRPLYIRQTVGYWQDVKQEIGNL
jgi:hypothetical protein